MVMVGLSQVRTYRESELRRLSTLGYRGLHAGLYRRLLALLATRLDWQFRALLATVGRS